MRRAIFLAFIIVGMAVGLVVGLDGDRGLRIVMMFFGALAGAALGGAITKIGGRESATWVDRSKVIPGLGMSSEDFAANYWRDKGRPPFTRGPHAEYGRHMFDPDKMD
jgi:hypothetical protein